MLSKVAQRLIGDEAAGIRPLDANKLTPMELARLLEVGVRIERLRRGVPDVVQQVPHARTGTAGEVDSALVRRIIANPEANWHALAAFNAAFGKSSADSK